MPRHVKEDPWTRLLAQLRRTGRRLRDVPAPVVRAALKSGIPGTRSILLPPPMILASLQQPILRDLLVTRVGYSGPGVGLVPRPEGSLDHILLYSVAGKGWLRIANRRWDLEPETAAFLPRGVPHRYGTSRTDPYFQYWIHFTGRQAAEYFQVLRVGGDSPLVHLPCTEMTLSAFERIYRHMSDPPSPPTLLAASAALAQLLAMVHSCRSQVEQWTRPTTDGVEQTLAFMQHNLSRRVTLRELTQLARQSVSGYEHDFKARVGFPPIAYFNRLKIRQAEHQLLASDLPVKRIAAGLGFEDPYHFSRLFKSQTGLAPAKFREAALHSSSHSVRRRHGDGHTLEEMREQREGGARILSEAGKNVTKG